MWNVNFERQLDFQSRYSDCSFQNIRVKLHPDSMRILEIIYAFTARSFQVDFRLFFSINLPSLIFIKCNFNIGFESCQQYGSFIGEWSKNLSSLSGCKTNAVGRKLTHNNSLRHEIMIQNQKIKKQFASNKSSTFKADDLGIWNMWNIFSRFRFCCIKNFCSIKTQMRISSGDKPEQMRRICTNWEISSNQSYESVSNNVLIQMKFLTNRISTEFSSNVSSRCEMESERW